jgi:RHS repeat-associated protein
MVTDERGVMIELLDYDPYGTERISWSSSSDSGEADSQKTYIGEYSDDESGLSYLNARYYDPKRGQFLSQDSVYLSLGSGKDKREQIALLDTQSPNSYGYGRGNPIKYRDSEGDFAFLIPIIVYGTWQAVEAGLTIIDTVNAVETLQNSSATTAEKAISIGGVVAGIALPGGGYGKVLNKVDDVVNELKPAIKALHRPYIRNWVREIVERNAKKIDGKFVDPNTRQVIDGKYDFGHKTGNEFWWEKQQAEKAGLTQKQFNDKMNNPDHYQTENPVSNRSRVHEDKHQ